MNRSRFITQMANYIFYPFATISIIAMLVKNNEAMSLNTSHEEVLIKRLLRNYNKKHYPPQPVHINFNIHLKKIADVIEKEETIVMDVYIDHAWIDQRLAWGKIQLFK